MAIGRVIAIEAELSRLMQLTGKRSHKLVELGIVLDTTDADRGSGSKGLFYSIRRAGSFHGHTPYIAGRNLEVIAMAGRPVKCLLVKQVREPVRCASGMQRFPLPELLEESRDGYARQ